MTWTYTIPELINWIKLAKEYKGTVTYFHRYYKALATAGCAAFKVEKAASLLTEENPFHFGKESDRDRTMYDAVAFLLGSFMKIELRWDEAWEWHDCLEPYKETIGAAVEQYGKALSDCLLDLFCKTFHLDPKQTITFEELRQQGFDTDQPEPDPEDRWQYMDY